MQRGVFAQLWVLLLEADDDRVGVDWQWQAADGCLVKAPLATDLDGQLVRRDRCLDRGYDSDACCETAAAQGYRPHLPPKASAAQPLPGDPARHPARRGVVEVGHAWFNRFRRLLIRWEQQAANYLAFIQLAACLIIYRKVRHAISLSG